MLPNLYDKLGAENLRLLVDYFYDEIFAHPGLTHLFKPEKKDEIKSKQLLFLTQFLGGPQLYSEIHGHPRLRARHMPHPISQDDAVAWLTCMSKAIAQLPIEESLKDELFSRFPQTAFFMVNQQPE
jgi:hemoglobin